MGLFEVLEAVQAQPKKPRGPLPGKGPKSPEGPGAFRGLSKGSLKGSLKGSIGLQKGSIGFRV